MTGASAREHAQTNATVATHRSLEDERPQRPQYPDLKIINARRIVGFRERRKRGGEVFLPKRGGRALTKWERNEGCKVQNIAVSRP